MKKYTYSIIAFLFFTSITGCKKFLDEKPNASLAIPNTLSDFQALLDWYPTINNDDAYSGEVSADNYFLTTQDYMSLSIETDRNLYTWQKDNLFQPQSNDWFFCYQPVFTANIILNGLPAITRTATNKQDYDNVRGEAYFVRARGFLQVAGLWASVYDPTKASSTLGIPIKLGTDFNQPSVRSTLEQTYIQIISDLKFAAANLPNTPVHVYRGSKPAAYGLLARTYLNMRQYDKAGLYADSCLQISNVLLDFNSLDTTASFPFQQFNKEVVHESSISTAEIFYGLARVDSNLYRSYANIDLRKSLYFQDNGDGTYIFKGSYESSQNLFTGIATDEMYLIRAESFARAGNTSAALKDLNTLLKSRYKTGKFLELTAVNNNTALALILTERRKELLMRALRWTDLKRLNADGAAITLTRKVNGQIYTLAPNDLRYVLPIPDDIIKLTGMQQNPR